MDKRFWMAFAGLVVFVGGGALYWWRARWQRVKLVRALIALPKQDRKLWYRLRQRGYEIVQYRPVGRKRIVTPDEPMDVMLQVEWLVEGDGGRWAVIRKPTSWGRKECVQSFFPALVLYRVKGVLWYDERDGILWPWEIQENDHP